MSDLQKMFDENDHWKSYVVTKKYKERKDKDNLPNSKAIITPMGEFSSINLASRSLGIGDRTLSKWLKDKKPGYYFKDENHANGTVSEETRAKISAKSKGKKVSEETRAKLSAAATGKTHSEDTRAKLSACAKGRTFSAEHRAKLSAAAKERATMKRKLKGAAE
jgi:hypothetical protein